MSQTALDIIKTSGVTASSPKAIELLEQFQEFFTIAGAWKAKAETLVVTNVSQVEDMKTAREGRLFIRAKRLDVEKTRKRLKEDSLREGRAIDGIANTLKGLLEPIEDHLDKQEHFAEYIEKARLEEEARKAAALAEEDRIKAEAAERSRIEAIRAENARLEEQNRALREEAAKKATEFADAQRAKEAAEAAVRRAEWQKKQEALAAQKASQEAQEAVRREEARKAALPHAARLLEAANVALVELKAIDAGPEGEVREIWTRYLADIVIATVGLKGRIASL